MLTPKVQALGRINPFPRSERKAFRRRHTEAQSAVVIYFPQDIVVMTAVTKPFSMHAPSSSEAASHKLDQAANLIGAPSKVVILAGNGITCQGTAQPEVACDEALCISTMNSLMSKGVIPFTNELSRETMDLKGRFQE